MFKNRLLSLLSMIGLGASFSSVTPEANRFRSPTSARRTRRYRAPSHAEDVVPRGYPGAKLARKAMKGTVGKATLR